MLKVTHVSKHFGGVKALDNTSLSLEPGEIRALLGSNGSGKSTLVKVLGGMVNPDKGEILLDGKPFIINSPRDSRRNGIAVAYQDLSLVPQLTVADNLMLGLEPRGKFGFTNSVEIRKRTLELLTMLQIEVDPETLVSELDPSMQSLVEVAKALAWKPRILILDEVTASMHHDQVERLFELLRSMQKEGLAILFVSHRFDEVFSLCRTATVLRGGETITNLDISNVNESDCVYHMTGKYPEGSQVRNDARKSFENRKVVLSLNKLSIKPKVGNVSMKVHEGEIIGIGGLQGQGQAEFIRAIYGAIPFSEGTMEFKGVPTKFKSPNEAIKKGIGFISGDREREGILSVRSVDENIFLAKTALQSFLNLIKPKMTKTVVLEMMERLNIIAGGTNHPANSLSGGNQQKLIVGRWLMVEPKLILLDDPTKGVDVVARYEIHHLLHELAETGTSVIFSSSDNEELIKIADRIFVFYEGKITAELMGAEKTEECLVSAMLGVGVCESGCVNVNVNVSGNNEGSGLK